MMNITEINLLDIGFRRVFVSKEESDNKEDHEYFACRVDEFEYFIATEANNSLFPGCFEVVFIDRYKFTDLVTLIDFIGYLKNALI